MKGFIFVEVSLILKGGRFDSSPSHWFASERTI